MTPVWNSIAESILPAQPARLTHTEAIESPCKTCPSAPCCTHLPLNTFKVTNLVELDHALYLLNFAGIELGISASGDWSSYYTFPCHFLNRESFECRLHNQPEQPRICVHYNPYNCWYKRVFTSGQTEDFIRIDYNRMQFLINTLTFDEQRRITSVPDWDSLLQLMAAFEDQKPAATFEPQAADESLAAWQQMVMEGRVDEAAEAAGEAFDPAVEPCADCAAFCCKTLVFPQAAPLHISNLDYYQFCLGFPGVELGISEGGWATIVKTTCRYLDGQNRCGLYGKAQRPLICKYYDSWKCDYKSQFGRPRPAGFLRVRLEQFAWLAECFEADAQGRITGQLPFGAIREHIESRWREAL